MTRKYCVYMHRFPNGKVYIGQTCQKPEIRFRNGNGYKGCRFIESAIKKYGWENVEHIILADNLDEDGANELEQKYIEQYKSTAKEFGYNLRSGGTSGYHYTETTKAIMREKATGKKRTQESKSKQSATLKRYYASHIVSEETREKLRVANTGKKRPQNVVTEQQLRNIKPHQFKKGHAPNEKSKQTIRERMSKKVIQYDKNMNVIAVHPSIAAASAAAGFKSKNAVGNAVRGRTKITGGYIWRYADGDQPTV